MSKPINLGILPQLLSGVSFNNEAYDIKTSGYYEVGTSIFKYLCRNQKQNGSIYDPNMASTLDAQYHQTNFSLSAIILYLLNKNDSYYLKSYNSLRYYSNIPEEVRKGASDFNNFPILVSYFLLDNTLNEHELKGLLKDYIDEMPHYASMERGHTYGNNFITLRALNHLLRFKILGEKEDIESAEYFMDCTLKWQFKDGIFYDYPRDFKYQKGIPSLAYHSKITLITLLFGLVSREDHIIGRAMQGLEALDKLISYDGEAFYYGRTNNALYGHACGILAYRIATSVTEDPKLAARYKKCEKSLFSFCSQYIDKDGHLYINANNLENERCGFDNYMYVTVYNAFTASMLLLSSLIKGAKFPVKNHYSSEIHYLADSGFIAKKGKKISTVFNLKGHNYYQQYLLDPRFTCCTPLFVKFNGHDILPTAPFSSPTYTRNENEKLGKKFWRKIRETKSEFETWGYLKHFNPIHAGFIPYLEDKKKWYMPICVKEVVVSEIRDMLVVIASGEFISIRRGGIFSLAIFMSELMKNFVKMPVTKLSKMMVGQSNSSFERTIIIHDNFIHFSDKIWRNKSEKVCFSFRTYSDFDNKLKNNHFLFNKREYGFAFLFGKGEALKRCKNLYSSKGSTFCWELINANHEIERKNKKTLTLKHTIIPFDKEFKLQRSVSIFNKRYKEYDKYLTSQTAL